MFLMILCFLNGVSLCCFGYCIYKLSKQNEYFEVRINYLETRILRLILNPAVTYIKCEDDSKCPKH